MPINIEAINRLIIVWKGIINDFTRIINIITIIEAKIGLINLKLNGCNFKIYHTSIERINPRKSIEINVAEAAPNPAYKGISVIFKIKFIQYYYFYISAFNKKAFNTEINSILLQY